MQERIIFLPKTFILNLQEKFNIISDHL